VTGCSCCETTIGARKTTSALSCSERCDYLDVWCVTCTSCRILHKCTPTTHTSK